MSGRHRLRGHLAGRLAALGALLLLTSLGCSPPEKATSESDAPPPPVEARASVDPAVATTGDVITYAVTVEHDPAIEVTMPDLGAQVAGFRIINLGQDEPRKVGQRVVERQWYELRADLVGSYVLPPVTVSYRTIREDDKTGDEARDKTGDETSDKPGDEAESPSTITISEIFVEVKSVLPAEGEAADIRDIKPLQPMQRDLPWRWILAASAVALALFVTAGIWWWRRRRPAKAKPALPAHLLAFQQLDALRHTDFTDPVAVRRFHFDLSEVVRGYVEGRFGLNATDLTRQEIIPLLADLPGLDPAAAAQLQEFLLATDRVKFAAFEPTSEQIEATYEQALSFVEATAPRDEEPSGDEANPQPTASSEPATAATSRDTSTGEEAA